MLLGDCLEKMRELPDNSVDSIVTDPPYGLSFMGKKWDYDVPSVEIWKEALRVLKPGGHLLSFGGTRTYHRLVVNIEDAGFEIRDQIQWLYGSGFPKSLDVSKAMDKAAGHERDLIPRVEVGGVVRKSDCEKGWKNSSDNSMTFDKTAVSECAKQWQGWGTALKPANEPICLARKPLEGTVAHNVEKWGCGALNIDASRVGTDVRDNPQKDTTAWHGNNWSGKPQQSNGEVKTVTGRWPANLILDEEAAAMLDEQSGTLKSGAMNGIYKNTVMKNAPGQRDGKEIHLKQEASSGGASRFFYCAKASKSERNAGLEGMPAKAPVGQYGLTQDTGNPQQTPHKHEPQQNFHPTVKPLKLMEYLIRLVTAPGGTVLDPFMGSGSTGVAAKNLGFKFIGIEMNEEYFEIAKKRVG